MSRYCQDTNIPSVNEEAKECCETTPSNCVIASEAIPCLQLGKGDTLTKALVNICKRIDQQNRRIDIAAGENITVTQEVIGGITTYTINSTANEDCISEPPNDGEIYVMKDGEWTILNLNDMCCEEEVRGNFIGAVLEAQAKQPERIALFECLANQILESENLTDIQAGIGLINGIARQDEFASVFVDSFNSMTGFILDYEACTSTP